jgi:hypothetical protein
VIVRVILTLEESRKKLRYDHTHSPNQLIGGARLPIHGQTLDTQLEQLRAAGCSRNIYREKVTGTRSIRTRTDEGQAVAPE